MTTVIEPRRGRVRVRVTNPNLQKLGWHDAQVMPDPKPSMSDSTVHSLSVVVVVSEHQGGDHFSPN